MEHQILIRGLHMEQTRIKVAILDNSQDSDVYTPVEHWKAFLPVPWQAYKATEGQFPSKNDGITHVILTGSEASIMERDPWVDEEVAFIQDAAASKIPMLGSCYGHQLLALALLGPAHIKRCEVPEMGWLSISVSQHDPMLGTDKAFFAFTLHFDDVSNMDEEFMILGVTKQCPIHIMKHHTLPIWGIQSHPEIDISAGKQLLMNMLTADPARKDLYQNALRMIPRDSGKIGPFVRQYLQAGS